MVWSRLQDRIDSLPLVLAGPMLRKTTPTSVTVWLALRDAATVTLEARATHVLVQQLP